MPSTFLAAALAISLHSFSGTPPESISPPAYLSPAACLATKLPADTTINSPFGAVVVTAALCWVLFLGVKDLGNFSSGGSNHSGSGSGSGGSGRSGGSWAGNISLPDFGTSSPSTRKKPAAAQPAVKLPPRILWKY